MIAVKRISSSDGENANTYGCAVFDAFPVDAGGSVIVGCPPPPPFCGNPLPSFGWYLPSLRVHTVTTEGGIPCWESFHLSRRTHGVTVG